MNETTNNAYIGMPVVYLHRWTRGSMGGIYSEQKEATITAIIPERNQVSLSTGITLDVKHVYQRVAIEENAE